MKKTKLTRSLMAAVSVVALSAVMYGCVHSGGDDAPAAMDPPPIDMDALDAAKAAAVSAASAAMTASGAAATAVEGVADDRTHDAVAYLKAEGAADAAMEAYMAAKAASDAAQDAETVADAEMYRDTAIAEQGKAADAQADAEMYAGQVTQARMAADDAATEAENERIALAAARTAADTAADDAATDSYAAMAELAGVMGMEGYDQASYDAAAAAAQAAADAATAAREASDAANRATTSADAEAHQMTAETQRGMAADALANATTYAGMVTEAKRIADEAEAARLAAEAAAKLLADTKMEASDAADDAMDASTEAMAAVEAQRANKDLSTVASAAFARAEDAAADAATASGDAAVASNAAQAAMTQDDAAMYRDQAVEAKRAAELAQANAMSFASMVAAVKTAMDNAATEAQMLADAKRLAGEAATDARQAATDAEAAAVAAETAAPGSTDARDARAAAEAAKTAAGLAEAADVAAQAATDSEIAILQQGEAEAQRNAAQGALKTAETNRDEAQDARKAAEQLQEERDLADAKQAALDLWSDTTDGIMFHYNAVMSKAGLAMGQAGDASDSADKAKYARTDYDNAKKQADAAKAASDEAQASLGRAMTAKGEADTARQAAMDATTSDAAEMALADLRAANAKLTEEHTGDTGAGMDYMAAKRAAMAAETAANKHVLGLLIHANAQDLDLGDPSDVDLIAALEKAKEARLKAVSDAIKSAAGDPTATADGGRDQDSSTAADAGTGSTSTVTASWFGNDLDNEDTADVDESEPKTLSITVTTSAANTLQFVTMDDPETDADERTATALDRGLGVFNGYSISIPDDATTENTDEARHAIVFTDKKQGAHEVAAVTAVSGRRVDDLPVTTQDFAQYSLGADKTGPTYTGVTWTPSDQEPLTGTLICSDSDAGCDIELDADGDITAISIGYEFTGSREAVAAVTPADAMEDNDYLAFGVWLIEDANGTTEGTPKAFAAFANGGEPIDNFATYVALTGKAEYSGKAAGVYTQGDSVDWFEGDASLMANFGAIDTDEERATDPPADTTIGAISGTISKIKVGGVDTDDEISLRSADIVNDNTAFSGSARMGTGVDTDDDDVLEYTYNGTWSGNFYGAVAAVPDDEDTEADESMPIRAPEAVAGTFGVSGTEGEG